LPKVKVLRLNGSDFRWPRLRYFTPKLKKNYRATLTSGGVNRQHDNDWNLFLQMTCMWWREYDGVLLRD